MLPPADAVLLNPTWGGEGGISLRACASSRGGAGVWLERCEPRPNPAALRTSMRDAAVFSRRCMYRVVAWLPLLTSYAAGLGDGSCARLHCPRHSNRVALHLTHAQRSAFHAGRPQNRSLTPKQVVRQTQAGTNLLVEGLQLGARLDVSTLIRAISDLHVCG